MLWLLGFPSSYSYAPQVRALRAKCGGSEYKRPRQKPCTAIEYQQQVQGLQGDVTKLTDELEEAGEALRNVLAENERKGLTNPFITLVGMKGDEYSQDKLGLKMMYATVAFFSACAWCHGGLRYVRLPAANTGR
jgi:hypothetical protein